MTDRTEEQGERSVDLRCRNCGTKWAQRDLEDQKGFRYECPECNGLLESAPRGVEKAIKFLEHITSKSYDDAHEAADTIRDRLRELREDRDEARRAHIQATKVENRLRDRVSELERAAREARDNLESIEQVSGPFTGKQAVVSAHRKLDAALDESEGRGGGEEVVPMDVCPYNSPPDAPGCFQEVNTSEWKVRGFCPVHAEDDGRGEGCDHENTVLDDNVEWCPDCRRVMPEHAEDDGRGEGETESVGWVQFYDYEAEVENGDTLAIHTDGHKDGGFGISDRETLRDLRSMIDRILRPTHSDADPDEKAIGAYRCPFCGDEGLLYDRDTRYCSVCAGDRGVDQTIRRTFFDRAASAPLPRRVRVKDSRESVRLADEVRSVANRARISRMQGYVLRKAADHLEEARKVEEEISRELSNAPGFPDAVRGWLIRLRNRLRRTEDAEDDERGEGASDSNAMGREWLPGDPQLTTEEAVQNRMRQFFQERVDHHRKMAGAMNEPFRSDHQKLARAYEARLEEVGGE